MPPRRHERHAAADSVARRRRAAPHRRPSCTRSSRKAPAGCPAFRRCRPRRVAALVALHAAPARNAIAPSTTRRAIAMKYRFTGYHKFLDPDGYPADRAAVGHAQRDRPEHGRVRLADPARRVPRAGRAGAEEHRHARTTAGRSSPPAAWCSSARPTSTGSSARSTRRPARLLWETTLPLSGNAHAVDLRGRRPPVRRRAGRRRPFAAGTRRLSPAASTSRMLYPRGDHD